jgi:hypothetical protein
MNNVWCAVLSEAVNVIDSVTIDDMLSIFNGNFAYNMQAIIPGPVIRVSRKAQR